MSIFHNENEDGSWVTYINMPNCIINVLTSKNHAQIFAYLQSYIVSKRESKILFQLSKWPYEIQSKVGTPKVVTFGA